MEDGPVVEAVASVGEKVSDSLRRFFGVQFQFDFAEGRANDDHGVFLAGDGFGPGHNTVFFWPSKTGGRER
jgi:hypothetical protein